MWFTINGVLISRKCLCCRFWHECVANLLQQQDFIIKDKRFFRVNWFLFLLLKETEIWSIFIQVNRKKENWVFKLASLCDDDVNQIILLFFSFNTHLSFNYPIYFLLLLHHTSCIKYMYYSFYFLYRVNCIQFVELSCNKLF